MKRNYSIDLLRIVSMNMIVLLHIIGCGGILENTRLFTLNYEVSWLLEILCYCAVNCYALISGYVMCYSEIKYNKIVELWFQVVFYTIGITLLFNIFNPSSINNVDILKAFIPMMSNQYWYFTSYTGMFFFIPLMNHVINTMEKKKIEVLLVSSIILFVIFPMFLLAQFDPFYIIDGYSMIWLMTLYLFGAYFRKYSIQKKFKIRILLIFYVISVILTFMIKLIIDIFTFKLFGELKLGNLFISYISPTILLASFSLFLFFIKIKIKNNYIIRMVKLLAPVSFGVYLIHTNPLVFSRILNGSFTWLTKYNAISIILLTILFALLIYLACSLIDGIRLYLFKKLKIDKLSELIVNMARKLIINIENSISMLVVRIND